MTFLNNSDVSGPVLELLLSGVLQCTNLMHRKCTKKSSEPSSRDMQNYNLVYVFCLFLHGKNKLYTGYVCSNVIILIFYC